MYHENNIGENILALILGVCVGLSGSTYEFQAFGVLESASFALFISVPRFMRVWNHMREISDKNSDWIFVYILFIISVSVVNFVMTCMIAYFVYGIKYAIFH